MHIITARTYKGHLRHLHHNLHGSTKDRSKSLVFGKKRNGIMKMVECKKCIRRRNGLHFAFGPDNVHKCGEGGTKTVTLISTEMCPLHEVAAKTSVR